MLLSLPLCVFTRSKRRSSYSPTSSLVMVFEFSQCSICVGSQKSLFTQSGWAVCCSSTHHPLTLTSPQPLKKTLYWPATLLLWHPSTLLSASRCKVRLRHHKIASVSAVCLFVWNAAPLQSLHWARGPLTGCCLSSYSAGLHSAVYLEGGGLGRGVNSHVIYWT